jgi:methionine aminotransferase
MSFHLPPSKLPHVGTTIFTVMSKLASEHKAINLSQGFPNFPVDENLQQLLIETARENTHQYVPMAGYPPLISQIGELIQHSYQRTCNDQEILVTAGATEAIFASIQAFVYSGDEVIVLDPSYDCYDPAIVLCGAQAIHVPLAKNFLPDWEAIENAWTNKTRMLIINNPHNPSGRVWKETDTEQLERLLAKFPNTLLLSDEVYEYITFEHQHISIHSRPLLHERSIVVSSFGKTFHITGWKIGYLVASEMLMREIKKVHQFLVFCVNSVAQVTLSKYLPIVNVKNLGEFYQEKRDLFASLLSDSRFRLLPSEGTYFQLADYSAISTIDDFEFCQYLTKDVGVAAIPLSAFNANKHDPKIIRFCFAKDNETLISAAHRLCKI